MTTANVDTPVKTIKPPVRVFEDGLASHRGTEKFIKELENAIKEGFGFVPFIGAGFSVAAGVPIVHQFAQYLRRCICVGVGAEIDDAARDENGQATPQRWNPRTDRWPPFIDLARPEPVNWQRLVYKRYVFELKKHKADPGQKTSATEEVGPWIYQEAFGAMSEWRTSLHFLSRLTLDKERSEKERSRPILDVPDQTVIDACLREVLRSERPSRNHVMLALLSQLLRIDLILTTNFDNLTEQAFERSRNPLEVFDVHLGDFLPEYDAVARTRSIVKLHGSHSSLRADYSLDGSPSRDDCKIFTDYVAGSRHACGHNKNHLILFGVSAKERRTKDFLSHALSSMSGLKLFWVCYSHDEIGAVEKFRLSQNIPADRFIVVRHTDAGLLLLHTYQYIRRSLPSTDALFPSNTRLPLPPLPMRDDKLKNDSTYKDFLRDLRAVCLAPHGPKRIIATARKGVRGVTSAAAEVFRELESKNFCLWLEMNDIYSADDLFEAFQEAAYQKLGETDWTPLYATKDSRPREKEIERIANSSINPLIIFIDARETPGANRVESGHFNGWIDGPERDGFIALLKDLTEGERGRIKVILLCREGDAGIISGLSAHGAQTERLQASEATSEDPNLVNGAIGWAANDREKQHFLQALLSIQRTRHLAVIWALCGKKKDGLPPNCDLQKISWLEDLEERKVLRRKDGGFIWFYSQLRTRLRKCLALSIEELKELGEDQEKADKLGLSPENIKHLMEWNAVLRQGTIHLELCSWYLKLFDATGTAPAILEAVDHLCLCAESRVLWNYPSTDGDKPKEVHLQMAARIVRSARQLLRQHIFLIQTQGHPRASIRRLDYIRDFWARNHHMKCPSFVEFLLDTLHVQTAESAAKIELKREIAKLQCVTVELSRALYREIGEEGEAFIRQREIAIRMTRDKPLSMSEVLVELEDPSRVSLSATVYKALKEPTGKQKGTSDYKQKDDEPKETSRKHEWIRWLRWCGMLGIASRSFREANRSLAKALTAAQTPWDMEIPSERSEDEPLLSWRYETWDVALEESYKCHLEALHSLELASFLLILQARTIQCKVALRAGAGGDIADISKYLIQAEKLAVKGIRHTEKLQSSGLAVERHDFELQWCKARLLMVAGIASMHDAERKEKSIHAMSFLGDAAACLGSESPERARADIALIELRRAEVRVQEASEEMVGEVSFEAWTYERLLGTSLDQVKADIEALPLEDIKAQLVKVVARATDAIRYLNRAFPTLRERRRNVWWTTWYFEYRLRAIALLVWTSVCLREKSSPIPFLGLEASMRLTDTEADTLLNDAVRMIRVDAYRLAMIVLAYASCARALQAKLILDQDAVCLPDRLKRMRLNLEVAVDQLKEARERRIRNIYPDEQPEQTANSNKRYKATVNSVAEEVIDAVLKRVDPVITGLRVQKDDNAKTLRGSATKENASPG